MLRAGEDYTVRGTDGNPAKIPARVREIITKNLAGEELSYTPSVMETTPSVSDLQEENRVLAAELNRVEEMLSASRAERDELGIKYNALSERVSESLCCCCWLWWWCRQWLVLSVVIVVVVMAMLLLVVVLLVRMNMVVFDGGGGY